MAIRTVVTRGYGNGTFNGTIALIVTRGYGVGAAVVEPEVSPPSQDGISFFGPFERVLRVVPILVRGELLLIGRVEAQLSHTMTVRGSLVLQSKTLSRLRIGISVQGAFAFDGGVRVRRILSPERKLRVDAEDWLIIDTDDWPILGLPWRE